MAPIFRAAFLLAIASCSPTIAAPLTAPVPAARSDLNDENEAPHIPDGWHISMGSVASPIILITHQKGADRLFIMCTERNVVLSFSHGHDYRSGYSWNGEYRINDGPMRPVRGYSINRSVSPNEHFSDVFVRDIAGADRVYFRFGNVERTINLAELKPHGAALRDRCRQQH